jgi:hypothetical protein
VIIYDICLQHTKTFCPVTSTELLHGKKQVQDQVKIALKQTANVLFINYSETFKANLDIRVGPIKRKE